MTDAAHHDAIEEYHKAEKQASASEAAACAFVPSETAKIADSSNVHGVLNSPSLSVSASPTDQQVRGPQDLTSRFDLSMVLSQPFLGLSRSWRHHQYCIRRSITLPNSHFVRHLFSVQAPLHGTCLQHHRHLFSGTFRRQRMLCVGPTIQVIIRLRPAAL